MVLLAWGDGGGGGGGRVGGPGGGLQTHRRALLRSSRCPPAPAYQPAAQPPTAAYKRMSLLVLYFQPSNLLEPDENFAAVSGGGLKP